MRRFYLVNLTEMLLIFNIVIVIHDFFFILILEASVLNMFAEPSLVKASVAKQ